MTFDANALSDYDSERGLLSSCQDGDMDFEVYAYALEKGITADHFTNRACQEYWNALVLTEKDGDFGMIPALQRLGGKWNEDNPRFMDQVLMSCETSTQGRRWVGGLLKAKKFRDLMEVSKKLALSIKDADPMQDPRDFAVEAEGKLSEMITPNCATLMTASELSDVTIEGIESEMSQGGATVEPYLPWLKNGLDGGFRAKQMVVIAARPSVGKTTFAMNLAYHSAMAGKKFLFFACEMSGAQLGRKLATIHAGKELKMSGPNKDVNKRNAEELKSSIRACSQLPIHVDDGARPDIAKIKATAKVLKRRGGLDALVIDYLGLMKSDPNIQNREQQVAEISKTCKEIAMELDIVVFLVCQLNREGAREEPRLHHLRESGQIEQDADIVILLHRDLLKDREDVKLIVAKNRFGGQGHSKDRIRFDQSAQRFIEVQPGVPSRMNGDSGLMKYDYNEEESRI